MGREQRTQINIQNDGKHKWVKVHANSHLSTSLRASATLTMCVCVCMCCKNQYIIILTSGTTWLPHSLLLFTYFYCFWYFCSINFQDCNIFYRIIRSSDCFTISKYCAHSLNMTLAFFVCGNGVHYTRTVPVLPDDGLWYGLHAGRDLHPLLPLLSPWVREHVEVVWAKLGRVWQLHGRDEIGTKHLHGQ